MKKAVLYLLSVTFFSVVFTQKTLVEIEFHIEGNKDTLCQLGYYKGKNMLVQDTILLNNKGDGIYRSENRLPQGVYFLYLKGGNYFDIMIGEDQKFVMFTKQNFLIEEMTVEGSEENEVFYDFMKFNKNQSLSILDERQEYDSLDYNTDSVRMKQLLTVMKPVNEAINQKREKIINDYSHFFISDIFKSMIPVDVPFFDNVEDQKERNKRRAFYNQNHYFDNLDLADARFLRTNHSVFFDRLEYFRDKLMYPIPDSINVSIDRLLDKTADNTEMYKYLVIFFTKHYEKSKIMCMDKVKLHMYNHYFLNDSRTDWLTEETRGKVEDLVKKMEFNQCGMEAPSLVVPDTTGNYVGINQFDNKYLVLYFWSSTCGHCKKTTPVLDSVYKNLKKNHDVEIFTVCIDDKKKEKTFKDYLKEHDYSWILGWGDKNYNDFRTKYNVFSTPTVYLLDRDKKIIGKDLNPEMLERIITNLDKEDKTEKEE
jgi:thiol-disulfide isomerase/thioredoxin